MHKKPELILPDINNIVINLSAFTKDVTSPQVSDDRVENMMPARQVTAETGKSG